MGELRKAQILIQQDYISTHMSPLADDSVQLHPYTSAWRWRFFWERTRLWLSLRGQVLEIQHVGSTAIPGMPAKPILDIMVVVEDCERAAGSIPTLERLGYEYKGENHQQRQHFFVKGQPTTHTLYLVEAENQELAARVRFRDYLIQHREAAQAYADLKAKLAAQHRMDLKAYQDGKLDFVRQVLNGEPAP